MTKRYLFCWKCNHKIGEKTPQGLKVESIILTPKQNFICRCGWKHNVAIAFGGQTAQREGLAALAAAKDQPVAPGGMHWDIFKELHDTGRLQIIPQENGSLLLVASPDGGEAVREAIAQVDAVLANDKLSAEEKAGIFLQGLRMVAPQAAETLVQPPPPGLETPLPNGVDVQPPEVPQPSGDNPPQSQTVISSPAEPAMATAGAPSEEPTSSGETNRGGRRKR